MSTEAKAKLKWFRLIQIVILPVMILSGCYMLISYFADLFGFDLSWTDHSLKQMIEFGGADVFHLGAFFWPVIGILAQRILTLVLAVYAWIGSFRFRKYSMRCWLAITVFGLLGVCALIYAMWEYGLNRGGIIQMAQYISAQTGRMINVSSGMVTAMRIILIITGVIALLYTAANFIYFNKRKHLFKDSDDYQEPYEDNAYVEPVTTTYEKTESPSVQSAAQPPVIEPATVAEPEPVPEPEPEPVSVIEPEPADEPEEVIEPEPVIETDEVTEEPAENDELDQLLKETEDSMKQFAGYEKDAVNEQTEESPAAIEPEPLEESEEPLQLTRSNPLAYEEEEEDPSLAATQILEPVEADDVKKEEINFCPDCGKRIPDPQMRFCIYCGRKIR